MAIRKGNQEPTKSVLLNYKKSEGKSYFRTSINICEENWRVCIHRVAEEHHNRQSSRWQAILEHSRKDHKAADMPLVPSEWREVSEIY